jgi:hypothetical protein
MDWWNVLRMLGIQEKIIHYYNNNIELNGYELNLLSMI